MNTPLAEESEPGRITAFIKFIKPGVAPFFFLFWLSVVIGATLSPFEFKINQSTDQLDLRKILIDTGESGLFDIIRNIFLFIPFGFSLAWLITSVRLKPGTTVTSVIFISTATSYAIEILQKLLETRFPSLIDVGANSLGGTLGLLVFFALKYHWLEFAWQQARVRWLYRGLLLVAALLWSGMLVLFLNRAPRLLHWDQSFPLLVGAEKPGTCCWKGIVYDLAFSPEAVNNNQPFASSFDSAGVAIIGCYEFSGDTSFTDRNGMLPDLIQRGETVRQTGDPGFQLTGENWLESRIPPAELTQQIMRSSQFSVQITLVSNNINQFGPARIVSLSGGQKKRNLTLSQHRDGLVIQFRSPLTGKNGRNRLLYAAHVFSEPVKQRLMVTYDGIVLRLFVNGRKHPDELSLAPWTPFPAGYLFSFPMLDFLIFKSAFYALLCLPIGVIGLLVLKAGRNWPLATRILLLVALTLPLMGLEIFLNTFGTQAFSKTNIILSFGLTLLPLSFGLGSGAMYLKRKPHRRYFDQSEDR